MLRFSFKSWLVCLGLMLVRLYGSAAAESSADHAASDALFTNSVVLKLQLEIAPSGVESLRLDPRTYVPVIIREGDRAYTNAQAHLKGSIGSFRKLEDKPGFTIRLRGAATAGSFHGLKKFHLNNSVQDASYLSEWVCTELFREAGVPATRVAHALVELNSRKLGLYVLLESMDQEFLGRYFLNSKGNLYGDSRFADISEPLARMEGKGELTRADLKALTAAAQERDPAKLVRDFPQVLDLDHFLSFMALEVMLCHWDGYTFAAHNYRVYEDPDSGKAFFFPHDMDQMLMDPNVPIRPAARGLVARSIFKLPEGRTQYRQRFETLFTNLFVLPSLRHRIDDWIAKTAPILEAYDPALARQVREKALGLEERLQRRAQTLQQFIRVPDPANQVLQVNILDADTQSLIPQSLIIPGYPEGDNGVTWDKTRFYRALHGSFYVDMVEARLPGIPAFLKFEAPGYMPVVAPYSLSTNAEDANYRIELKKGERLTGVVYLPDGTPARDAQVTLVTDSGSPPLGKGQLLGPRGPRLIQLGPRARFAFSPDPEAMSVVAVHEKGFAEMPIDEVSSKHAITLQPWGQIEATLLGRPGGTTQLVAMVTAELTIPKFTGSLYRGTPSLDPESFGAEVFTNRPFAIEQVPPGERFLWRSVMLDNPVHPAEPELGFVGRRLLIKRGETCHLAWGDNEGELRGQIAPDTSAKKPAELPDLSDLSDLRPISTIGFIRFTRAATATATARQPSDEFFFTLGPNDSFAIPGLRPGEFRVEIRIFSPPAWLGSVETNICIPAGSGAASTRRFDLGTLAVHRLQAAAVGQFAPSFNLLGLDHSPVRLADHRGKFILLHFWASWCGQQATVLPVMRAVAEAFQHNERFVMIGLNLDRDPQTAARYAQRNTMSWPQGHLGDWFETLLPSEYGVRSLPAAVLVGPDGKIVASNLGFGKLLASLKQQLE